MVFPDYKKDRFNRHRLRAAVDVRWGVWLLLAALLGGCASTVEKAPEPEADAGEKHAKVKDSAARPQQVDANSLADIDNQNQAQAAIENALLESIPLQTEMDDSLLHPLSPGDRVSFRMLDSASLDGIYEVDMNGSLNFPFIPSISVAGLSMKSVEEKVNAAYRQSGIMHPDLVRASLLVQRWAEVRVGVRGAVYRPGMAYLRLSNAEKSGGRNTVGGHSAESRRLSAALKAAAGITPYARLDNVVLSRGGKSYRFDLTGLFTGKPFVDPMLVNGDQVWLPVSDKLNSMYMRVSSVTPPGIQVIVSNSTELVQAKSLGFAQRDIEYGSRVLELSVVNACVGGTFFNRNRRIALVQRNPATRELHQHEVSSEDLVKNYEDEAINPYLLPGAIMVCYDGSKQTSLGVFDALYKILLPISVLKGF